MGPPQFEMMGQDENPDPPPVDERKKKKRMRIFRKAGFAEVCIGAVLLLLSITGLSTVPANVEQAASFVMYSVSIAWGIFCAVIGVYTIKKPESYEENFMILLRVILMLWILVPTGVSFLMAVELPSPTGVKVTQGCIFGVMLVSALMIVVQWAWFYDANMWRGTAH